MGKNITMLLMSLALMLNKIRLSSSDLATTADGVFVYVWAAMAVVYALVVAWDAVT